MKEYKIEDDFIIDGYRCVIVGQSLGHRCGYIGIPKGHILYGKHYDEIRLSVHGGLTYAGGWENSTYPVPSNLWWFGFDCAHAGDGRDLELIKELAGNDYYEQVLKLEEMFPTRQYETVRTKEYVKEELIYAVRQLTSSNVLLKEYLND